MSEPSPLTRRLIRDGLKRPADVQADARVLAERCEQAAQAGTPVVQRRRVLLEAATFIRAHHNAQRKGAAA